ncbi:MAG: hypothetical protein WDO16_17835 [Bacteroidota bacterium]
MLRIYGTDSRFRGKFAVSSQPPANNQLRVLDDCDLITLTRQSEIDSFNVLHPGCTTIGNLVINGMDASPAITNLDSLLHITAVTTDLSVMYTSLTDLSGLSGLTQVGGVLQAEHNALLASIGLNDLTLLGSISFRDLPVLTSMSGLSAHINTIGAITIDSTALTDLNGLEGIESITISNGGLNISHTLITSLGDLTNLKTITGYIRLDANPDFTHTGLTSLTDVWGFLFSSMPNLTSLAGLTDNLVNTQIGTFWMMNTGLTNLTGLDNITGAANFYIWFNNNLTSLQGLAGLQGNIGGGIAIFGNNILTDISSLSNITAVDDGTLEIRENNILTDLTGLGNITEIGGGLWIWYNSNLNSLSYLNNNLVIENNNGDEVKIVGNPQLALCSLTPLCNYLNGGGPATVDNNGAGCNSVEEILASCTNCASGMLITWTGANSSDWNDASNWSPASVPGTCDTVYIPEVNADYPVVNSNITIHGLIMDEFSVLDLHEYNLVNNGPVQIINAEIRSYGGGNSIIFRNAVDPRIEDADLHASNIKIERYTGTMELRYNYFTGDVTISDDIERLGPNYISGNYFDGNLNFTANSPASSAETSISSNYVDQVYGNAIFNIKEPVHFSAGNGYSLRIHGDLELNTDVDPDNIYLGEIEFGGGSYSYIRQTGSTPITMNTLFTTKNASYAYIIPEQTIYIKYAARFFIGIIKTTPSNPLVFLRDATVNQFSSSSWVWGPVKKIGNQQFTFPVGDSSHQGVMTILSTSDAANAYTATYYHNNPTAAGYDTAPA